MPDEKRGPGRPPAEPTAVLSVRVPVAVYDRACQVAAATGQTVAAIAAPAVTAAIARAAISVNNNSRG